MKTKIKNFISRHNIKIYESGNLSFLKSIGITFNQYSDTLICDGHGYYCSVYLWNHVLQFTFNTYR